MTFPSGPNCKDYWRLNDLFLRFIFMSPISGDQMRCVVPVKLGLAGFIVTFADSPVE